MADGQEEKKDLTPEEEEAERARIWHELEEEERTGQKGGDKKQDETVDGGTKTEDGKGNEGLSDKAQTPEKTDDDPVTLKQRLTDTQTWGHKLADENKELKRLLDEQKKGKATQEEVDAQKQAVEDATAELQKTADDACEEYPELKPIFDQFIETTKKLTNEVATLKKSNAETEEQRQRREALDAFNRDVKPKILEKHADFDKIIADDAYWEWAKKQRPSLRYAAFDSPDPEDIAMAVSEFKKYLGTDEAKAKKTEQEQRKQQKITDAQTLRAGSRTFQGGTQELDPNDPANAEEFWNQAGETLKKQGVG